MTQTRGPVTVVIPTYNERDNLHEAVVRVLTLGDHFRVIVVDDASPDGTGELADEMATAHPGQIDVIHRSGKQGLGTAYVVGFRHALAHGADLVVSMDADLSHPADRLPAMVEAAANADLVLGSRYVPGGKTVGWPFHRRLLSRFGSRYAHLILGLPVHDLTGGYKVYRRAALEGLNLEHLRADGYGFQIETTWRVIRNGGRVVEIPITFTDRVAGASKLSRSIVLEAALLVWRLRLDRIRERRRG
ncbi:MAG TPA: polyprenol monophosphomannose synthase [Thermomicrobiales bacterium]|nr:polyprenol monophosphomannose synthase [Thermomicrobiales bacterium]